MEIELTKDADDLICNIYSVYKERLKSGVSKSDAKFFGSSHNVHAFIMPGWKFDDVDDTCRELSRTGFLNVTWADNIASIIFLTDDAIAYCENRILHKVEEATGIIGHIRSLFPS